MKLELTINLKDLSKDLEMSKVKHVVWFWECYLPTVTHIHEVYVDGYHDPVYIFGYYNSDDEFVRVAVAEDGKVINPFSVMLAYGGVTCSLDYINMRKLVS